MKEITRLFLEDQDRQTEALAAQSGLLDVHWLDAQHFVARFTCKGLVRAADGRVSIVERHDVGFWFSDDYQSEVNPAEALTWLDPPNAWHPNIAFEGPFICAGPIAPGTAATELIYRVYELIIWANVTMREDDALNRDACMWARHNLHRFPVDRRGLKWQPGDPA